MNWETLWQKAVLSSYNCGDTGLDIWTTKQFQEKGHLYGLTRWGLPPASQRRINQIWQPRLASVIWPFWNWISFPHTLPFPAISCPSKMSSTTSCHRQALTVEPEAYVGHYGKALYKRVIWKNNLLRFIVLLFIFRKKRKFTRCKGLTQYIIIGDNSLYTLTQALAWPVLGRTWTAWMHLRPMVDKQKWTTVWKENSMTNDVEPTCSKSKPRHHRS